MINGDEFKILLNEKFGSVKGAAERLETTEQNIYRIIRSNKVSTKFLEKLSKAIRINESEIIKRISQPSVKNYNSNTNTVNNTIGECSEEYVDELAVLRKELAETKDELLRCKDELITFYKKNMK